MPPVLIADAAAIDLPQWVQVLGTVVTILGAGAFTVLINELVKARAAARAARTANRRMEEEIDQGAETFAITNLKGIIRDLRARVQAEAKQCDDRLNQLQEELRQIRSSERQAFAESVRQAEVVKRQGEIIDILQDQVNQLRAELTARGVNVISSEHPPV